MDKEQLKQRTKQFALRVLKLIGSLRQTMEAQVIGRQLLRSATSVGANYRAACRSRSRAEFVAKPGIVEEETDETAYWLELLVESRMIDKEKVEPLIKEAHEIIAIMAASRKSASGRS